MALGTILPQGYCTRTSGSALTCLLHVLPGCTASGDICARTLLWPLGPSRPPGGEAQSSYPLSVRYRRVNRSPGVDEEGRGDGLGRCGGRDHM
jgi:hypothetical protein